MLTKGFDTVDYSIVICTYNPDERILRRCMDAVTKLDTVGISIEVLLVDNNSIIPVAGFTYIKEYIEKIPSLKTILVKEQGVKYARMAAIEQAKGKYIVYFDYDNEPAPDYLQELKKLNKDYPNVAAWGPGNVWVDFIDGIDKRIEDYARTAFQEKHDTEIMFDNKPEWQSCYPFGTGLCTNAFLLKEYTELAKQGHFTLSGRKGNRLSSGEDTQMVMLCISKGFSAGVSPALKIRHIIPGSRANYLYLQRLAYGTGVCYESCLLQVFPERRSMLEKRLMPGAKFFRRAFKKLVKAKMNTDPRRMFELADFLGSNAGVYAALEKPLPSSINRILSFLKID